MFVIIYRLYKHYIHPNRYAWTVCIGFSLRSNKAVQLKLKACFTFVPASLCTAQNCFKMLCKSSRIQFQVIQLQLSFVPLKPVIRSTA